MTEIKKPKVFISYSWTDPQYQELIRLRADRLIDDGIEVIMDIYDLKEGQDQNQFMEKMVSDPSVSHVLIMCDKKYAEKADERKAGVGTETQIISKEVYDNTEQTKFIPIICEFNEDGKAYLPVFLKSRIYIDFSSPEAENNNWERLIRLLYNKPEFVKPKIGNVPAYITDETAVPTSDIQVKFNTFKHAIQNNKKGINHYRQLFLDACIQYADQLRVRERPKTDLFGEKVYEDCKKLKIIRDYLVDWVFFESADADPEEFSEILIEFLEKLRELKSRPPEVTSWQESWFEAHAVFIYETFLYLIAALLQTKSYSVIHDIYFANYLMPITERFNEVKFDNFDTFYGYSRELQILAPSGQKLNSPAAELIKRHADRKDLPFTEIIQAELLTQIMSFITPDSHWFPQTLYYATYKMEFPFFVRAIQRKYFKYLAQITGISDIKILREKIKEGYENSRVSGFNSISHRSFWSYINIENWGNIE